MKTRTQDCDEIQYKSNPDLQRWILARQGIIDFENQETGVKGAFNPWQVVKQFRDELVPEVGSNDILCNILEMVNKGWLMELYDSIITTDDDSRRFSMTTNGMLQFRKEIHPVAQMLVNQEKKLEEKIQKASTRSEVKNRIIQELKGFGIKFKDGVEQDAVEHLITTMKVVGPRSIPAIMDALKDAG
jgi:hypothetical protein